MDITSQLTQIGLSTQQAKIYLACLQLGKASVLNIARFSELKRPSVYLILDDLQQRGLVTKTQQQGKTIYVAESPTTLVKQLDQQRGIAEDILPTLQALYNTDPEKPHIKIAEGITGVRAVYNTIFDHLNTHPQEELLIFGALKDAATYFETEVVNYFYSIMSKTHNPIREIGNNDLETRKYFRQSHELNPNHTIRFIQPDDGAFLQSDSMIYGNTLVQFSVKEKIFAISIQSTNLANSYRALFNMAWRGGKKL